MKTKINKNNSLHSHNPFFDPIMLVWHGWESNPHLTQMMCQMLLCWQWQKCIEKQKF